MTIDDILARANADGLVTRDEAEAVIRSVTRSCKGPVKKGKEEEYAELRRKAGMFGDSSSSGDYNIALVDSLNRDFCGADFNDIVVGNPYDGKEREVKCHKCGQPIRYTAPYFKLKD